MPIGDFGAKKAKQKPPAVVESTPPKRVVPAPRVKPKRVQFHVMVDEDAMDAMRQMALDKRCNLTQLLLLGMNRLRAEDGLPPL